MLEGSLVTVLCGGACVGVGVGFRVWGREGGEHEGGGMEDRRSINQGNNDTKKFKLIPGITTKEISDINNTKKRKRRRKEEKTKETPPPKKQKKKQSVRLTTLIPALKDPLAVDHHIPSQPIEMLSELCDCLCVHVCVCDEFRQRHYPMLAIAPQSSTLLISLTEKKNAEIKKE